MDMSSLHKGETRWHFPGCCTLNQRDQQYVECQHGDIWFPFYSCGITAGMPADITILPSWRRGLSDFSFHFNVFKNIYIHITANCEAPASSWYYYIYNRFDLTKAIWCQWHLASASGDRQVKEKPVSRLDLGGSWDWGLFEALLRIRWCWVGHLINTQTHYISLTMDHCRIPPQHPFTDFYKATGLLHHFTNVKPEYKTTVIANMCCI